MEALRSRVETWIRDQTHRIMAVRLPPPPPPPLWRWPPWKGRDDRRERERRLREEYERQRKQLHDLCRAVKADSVADLQEVICSMVLSECVYKRPADEMIWYINKFKSDFGGQIVSVERVQPSLDHVPHRYLLAEAGDTLYASFIGTKQYKDVIADVNILQGAIFHDDDAEDFDLIDISKSDQYDGQNNIEETNGKPPQTKTNRLKNKLQPAAHRGFLARAKGIPALELYKLAQKKNQKLVLCGHSLGGAVAALATLAILRVLVLSPLSKDYEKVNIKCITFSQPPVGNAALRDYVHHKGWQHHFKTYCIPEDLVPRILSPAYFHHYNTNTPEASSDVGLTQASSVKLEEETKRTIKKCTKETGEQLVLGLGPLQTSFWRLSKLVPIDGVRKQLNLFRRAGNDVAEARAGNNDPQSTLIETNGEPQSLEIQEGSEGFSLSVLPDLDKKPGEANGSQEDEKSCNKDSNPELWRRAPYLPSYVPFGQLYLLGRSSVELLSEAEYSKLISVRSVITELRKRFQSHSMKSYRSRFQKIYDMCMSLNTSLFLGAEQLPQSPNLQEWLGLAVGGTVELGHIVEPPIIHTATSIIPLGWSGFPGDKNAEPLKVDIIGRGLHLCTVVQAHVNGNWCSTAVESIPSMPHYSSNHHLQSDLQKMRILVGAPLKKPPKHFVLEDSLLPVPSSPVTDCASFEPEQKTTLSCEEKGTACEGITGFVVYCTSDFVTISKQVHFRTRTVRLLGFEGAGKTCLLSALIKQGKQRNDASFESIIPELNVKEAVVGGVCYLDSTGVNLQELHLEANSFRNKLQMGFHDLSRKTDLVVLVHNLSQRIPLFHQSDAPKPHPALSLFLNDARSLGVPCILAITNKFSVSADQQKLLVDSAMEAYQASPNTTEIVNSCPFVIPSTQSWGSACDNLSMKMSAQKIILAPVKLARIPFRRKPIIMPVEGINALRQVIHRVLKNHEEMAFQELANERLSVELARESEGARIARQHSDDKGSSITAAAVGASLGAGLGLVMAVVMGAASALRKP